MRASAGIFAGGVLTFAALSPASAQGLFELLFGGFGRHEPTNARSYAEPSYSDPSADWFRGPSHPSPRSESTPATAYCVRTSDGFYFPVQPHGGVSPADVCHAFCPGSRLYSGSGIDNAVAADGSRYANLDTAFLYRTELVAGATCNGRDHFGLARIDITTDPTLRPGDVVATKTGLLAVTGMKNKVADFTPIDSYRGLAKSTRNKLADMKIMPPNPGAPKITPVTMATTGRAHDENRRAQLAR